LGVPFVPPRRFSVVAGLKTKSKKHKKSGSG
jgi:hypothetical protein